MNATITSYQPLPNVLDQFQTSRPHRRTHVNGFGLAPQDLDRFNLLLARLGRTSPPLEPDQLATAARVLSTSVEDDRTPAPCIVQRLQQAQVVEQMLGDHDWEPANEVLPSARDVVDYLHDSWHLIPGSLPQVGHLDEAIVIDTVWPQLSREVANFLDYQRLRRAEAELRGSRYEDIRFSREIWLKMHRMELELIAQRRRIRESSYAPELPTYFRVH